MFRPAPHRRSPLTTFALLTGLCALLTGCATARPTDPFAAQQVVAGQPGTALVQGVALPAISVFPGRLVAPIGNEVLVVATVNTADRAQAPYQRVEWILAPQGVGTFLATGESDRPFFFSGKDPVKLDNSYLISETAATGHVLQRGTATPADDVTILPGQAWLTMTSPTEGVSYVTAYAPDLQGAYGNRQTAAIHWVDARWTLPPQFTAQTGGSAPLAVTVYRQSSGLPVANWRVRYTISGGPPANFTQGGAQTFEGTTNAAGQAIADLTQSTPQAGVNTITVELVRPETVPGATEPLIVGTATTQVVWSETGPVSPAPITPGGAIPVNPGPGGTIPLNPPPTQPGTSQPGTTTPPAAANPIKLNLIGPTSVATGQEIKFQLEITNTGTTPINQAVITAEFDQGLENKVIGKSPVRREITDAIAPGRPMTLMLPFTAARAGQQCINVTLSTLTGPPAQARACLNVIGATPGIATPPKYSIKVTPSTRQAPLGSDTRVTVEIENSSNEAINDLQLEASFGPELPPVASSPEYSMPGHPEYQQNANPNTGTITWQGLKIPANGRLTPPLEIAIKPKSLTPPNKPALVRIYAQAGGQPQTQETSIEVIPPQAAAPTSGSQVQMEPSKNTNTQQLKVGTSFRYSFLINNIGSAPDRNIQLVVKLPEQLQLAPNGLNTKADVNGQLITFEAIPELRPTTGTTPDRPRLITIEVTAAKAGSGNGTVEAVLNSQGQAKPQTYRDDLQFYNN
jgi:uncharacterized repeat protein (TIGR01451 family)